MISLYFTSEGKWLLLPNIEFNDITSELSDITLECLGDIYITLECLGDITLKLSDITLEYLGNITLELSDITLE